MLFGAVLPDLGFRFERVGAQHPDGAFMQIPADGNRRVNIEFDYRSSNYRLNLHISPT